MKKIDLDNQRIVSFSIRLKTWTNNHAVKRQLRPRPHVSRYFWIRTFFFPDILPNNKLIWRHNSNRANLLLLSTYCRTLYGACSEHILLQRNPGLLSESGYHRMNVDRRIEFECATCGRENFYIRKETLRVQKYSDACGRGLSYFRHLLHQMPYTALDFRSIDRWASIFWLQDQA